MPLPTEIDLEQRAQSRNSGRNGGSVRIPELDGIRGIAIGMVLAWHYFFYIFSHNQKDIFSIALIPGRLAWSGVDLFFVLSGFLIGGILLDARESTNYFKVFYVRRFCRILPIYFAFLVGMAVLLFIIQKDPGGRFSWLLVHRMPILSYFTFVQNFWMALKGNFGSYGLSVTWSLAVEEQFYLTLPFIVRFVPPRRLIGTLIAMVLAAPALRICLHLIRPDLPYATFVLMPCRADALLLGVLAAVGTRSAQFKALVVRNRRTHLVVLLLLSSAFLVLPIHNTSSFTFRIASVGLTWLALFYVCLLLYAVVHPESILSRFLRWPVLIWLGTIAYGTYLVHQIVLGWLHALLWSSAPEISSAAQFMVSLVAVALTLVICRFSWIYFEKPFIRMGHRLPYRFVPSSREDDV